MSLELFRAQHRIVEWSEDSGSVRLLWAEFSRRFPGRPVFVAGGAVRDVLRGVSPKDYDVFIGGKVCKTDLDKGAVNQAIEALRADFELVPMSEAHQSEVFMVAQFKAPAISGESVVQVMYRPGVDTAQELLDTFDWETSLFAFDGASVHTRCADPFPAPNSALRLQQTKFSSSTLRRGIRFSERFGLKLPRETFVALCRDIVTKEDARDAAAAQRKAEKEAR